MERLTIAAAQKADWQNFLALVDAEGWRVPHNEIAFHRRRGSDTAFALRRAETTIGLVTAVQHEQSGWIGNLLIAPHERGRGCGARLFEHAVTQLHGRGVVALWLTASMQGAPLYARRGFTAVGEVVRWVRPHGGHGLPVAATASWSLGVQADTEGWGDRRSTLLRHLGRTGRWLAHAGEIALLQDDLAMQIIGPWHRMSMTADSHDLLSAVVASAAPGRELLLDAIDRPDTAQSLQRAGFTPQGRTTLMRHGALPGEHFDRILALASLGSIG